MRNIILLIMVSMIGCFSCFKEEDLGNKPIDIPEYVCYALFRAGEDDNSVRDYIIVIDMEKDSIIGIHKVSTKGHWVTDFCLGRDGYLYFVLITAGYVQKFDPKKGEIIDELKIPSSAGSIYSIPNDEAFILQYFRGAGDTALENSVIDLKNFTYKKKIDAYLGGCAYRGEVFFSPDSEVWIYISRSSSSPFLPHNKMVKFYPVVDTLGEVLEFEDEYNGDRIRVDAIMFLSNDKIYAKCMRVLPDESGGVEECVVVYEFPSLQILKYIPLNLPMVGSGRSIITLPNNKVYVSYYIVAGEEGHRIDDKYIYVFDGTNDEFIKKVDCGLYGPYIMEYSPSLNKVYVFSGYEKKISVINPMTDEVIKVLVFGEGETFLGSRIIVNK